MAVRLFVLCVAVLAVYSSCAQAAPAPATHHSHNDITECPAKIFNYCKKVEPGIIPYTLSPAMTFKESAKYNEYTFTLSKATCEKNLKYDYNKKDVFSCSGPVYGVSVQSTLECTNGKYIHFMRTVVVGSKVASTHTHECATKADGLYITPEMASKGVPITFRLPKEGPCSNIRNFCVGAHETGACQIQLANPTHSFCSVFSVSIPDDVPMPDMDGM